MSEVRENKMGVMDVKPLIVSMSLPMMISMLVQALYNVVDSIFVAQVDEAALAAVTFAFPLQNLMIAVASGTGVGINALLSRSLGAKKFDRADSAANAGILLAFCSFLVFLVIGLFGTEPFIGSQTGDTVIRQYGQDYLSIVCIFSLGLFLQVTGERLLQSTGKTIFSMVSQLTGAVVNIIMDPLLIFGLFGFPKLGVAGAAIATVAGQSVAGILALILNIRFNKEIHLSFRRIIKPEGSTVKEIYQVGVPSILMMSIGSIMTYLMNQILAGFSTTATAVFGVYFRLQSFFFMPIFGLNSGLIPVLAYNYGAAKRERIEEALRFSLVLAVSIMTVGTLVFETVPELLLSMFSASDEMMEIGVPALRIIAIHFPVAGCAIILGSVFQAFSKSSYSLIVSLGRQIVVLIPAAWLLSLTGNVNNVWWSFLIAEGVSLVLTLVMFSRIKRFILDKL
mgnify:CR=1 FL=1